MGVLKIGKIALVRYVNGNMDYGVCVLGCSALPLVTAEALIKSC